MTAAKGPYSAKRIDPAEISEKVVERFDRFVVVTPGCDVWTGATTKGRGSYGRFRIGATTYAAHRVAYVIATGQDVPAGTVLDHACGVTECVNPEHLDVVTQGENVERSRLTRNDLGQYEAAS